MIKNDKLNRAEKQIVNPASEQSNEQAPPAIAQAAPPITGSKQWKDLYAAIAQYAQSLKSKQ